MSLPITTNLNATQCPTPQSPSSQVFAANSGSTGNAPKSASLIAGDTGALLVKFNQNATRNDVVATYGGGGFAILWGLTLSGTGSSLNLTVAAGQANINSLVELPSGGTLTLPASSAACYIWLLDSANLSYVNLSLVPPSSSCVFLGTATTNSSGITGLDSSGVVYMQSNALWRQTADTGQPGDTPPSNMVLITKGSRTWIWHGFTHRELIDPTSLTFPGSGATFGKHTRVSYQTYQTSGTVALNTSSPNILDVLPTAAGLVFTLPSTGTIDPGMSFTFNNYGSLSFTVKDATATITIATVSAGNYVVVNAGYNSSGVLKWPNSATPQSLATY